MKKSLLAMAVAAALPAVATAQVTISGLLDIAYGSSSGFQKGQTLSTRDFTSSTSSIRFTATEDLGGGMRATVVYDIDPRLWMNAETGGSASTVSTAATTPGQVTLPVLQSGLARNESFVGLSGNFGNIRLGTPNSIGLTTWLTAAPLGTGIGSGYGNVASAYSFVRHNRSLRYDSPNISGLTFSINYAPGGDRNSAGNPTNPNAAGAGAGGVPAAGEFAAPSATLTPGHQIAPLSAQVQEVGASYAAGPLALAIGHIRLPGQNVDGTQEAQATKGISHTLIAGRYTIGSTVISGGWNQGDMMQNIATFSSVDGLVVLFSGAAPRQINTVTREVSGWRVGIQHDIGAISLRAQYSGQEMEMTDGSVMFAGPNTVVARAGANKVNWSVFGLRADYNLSKRTAVYLGYENWSLPSEIADGNLCGGGTPCPAFNNTGTAAKAEGTLTQVTNPTFNEARTLVSVGLRHSF